MKKKPFNLKEFLKNLGILLAITLVVTLIFGMDFMGEHKLWFFIPWLILAYVLLSPEYEK